MIENNSNDIIILITSLEFDQNIHNAVSARTDAVRATLTDKHRTQGVLCPVSVDTGRRRCVQRTVVCSRDGRVQVIYAAGCVFLRQVSHAHASRHPEVISSP